MGERSSNRLASNLEQLVTRLESIHSQKSSELDQVSGVLANMDKLVDIVSRVELQRQAEYQLNEQLDKLNEIIENLSGQHKTSSKREVSVEETLRKVIKGVKVTGKVMDIVAGSLGVMFDSIVATVKAQERQGAARHNKEKEVDLASILTPLGNILQGLLSSDQVDNNSAGKPVKTEENKDE
ncbi:hypothetical protein [Desulforamulus hydrothermalis]|uniref:Uncharacterized protein n=1 Tax=Desulforamulus hydrothermalis Lam5 = DSM 18033 TaxID=1121428 RepID=K8DZN8_9FIRM|nr:hypothetical protein [Desulforamulus hydrothermalis]CCO08589.1 conserved hypothetical protein [Desulforamulus hydrothermalis Lam5 = DSM 18033]SHH01580.1 hypothetical protein SAMN02745177_01133 [Desulforamulus hydrothermalis Lam5 = DSM 18033]